MVAGSFCVNALNACMAIGAAQHCHVEHSNQFDIINIRRLTSDQARVLTPLYRRTNHCCNTHVCLSFLIARNNVAFSRPLLTRAYWSSSRCTHLFSSILDSTHDVLIACAAADIALETFAYLVFSRVRVVLEQLIRGHNHPRRAEATLQAVLLPEAFLDRMQAALRSQSLNRGHFTAISLHRQHRARLDGIAVEQYRPPST